VTLFKLQHLAKVIQANDAAGLAPMDADQIAALAELVAAMPLIERLIEAYVALDRITPAADNMHLHMYQSAENRRLYAADHKSRRADILNAELAIHNVKEASK
jgi:hypothetical protein